MGRPTDYTPDLADLLCDRIADGASLRKVCLAEDMPNKATVFRWLRLHDAFRDQYTRACEERGESYADEIAAISDGSMPAYATEPVEGEDGQPMPVAPLDNAVQVQRDRLRVDARKWVASKLHPKKYGDKLAVDANHSGAVQFGLTIHDKPREST